MQISLCIVIFKVILCKVVAEIKGEISEILLVFAVVVFLVILLLVVLLLVVLLIILLVVSVVVHILIKHFLSPRYYYSPFSSIIQIAVCGII